MKTFLIGMMISCLSLFLPQLTQAQLVELLVKVQPGTSETESDWTLGMETFAAQYQHTSSSGLQVWQVEKTYADALCQFMQTCHPELLIAPNDPLYLTDSPNDPLFSNQWALSNDGTYNGCTGGVDIGVDAIWELVTGADPIRVAMIDGGADPTHPDLQANLWTNADEIPGNNGDDDFNGFKDDIHGWDFVDSSHVLTDVSNGHGGHVAGIVGATADNGIGIAGICWNCELMILKFTDSTGKGSTAKAIEAIDYAIQNGAQIINASWGGSPYNPHLYEAIERAKRAGILFVAAAGNNAKNNDNEAFYPASYDLSNIIAVGATDCHDQLIETSNFGATSVDILAPGLDIVSTIHNGGYGILSGTSMAAPHVTGAAALLWQTDPSRTIFEIKDRLIKGADLVPGLTGTCVANGRLNILKALRYANRSTFSQTYSFMGDVDRGVIRNVSIDPSGNVYGGGQVRELTVPNWQYYLKKIDQKGNIQWAKAIKWDSPIRSDERGWDMQADQDGNLLLMGSIVVSNDPVLDRPSTVVVKMDPAGDTIWAKAYRFPDAIRANATEVGRIVLPLANGDYLYHAQVSLDLVPASAGNESFKGTLMRTNRDGDILWNQTMELANNDLYSFTQLLELQDETLFAQFGFADSLFTNPAVGITKFNPAGELIWAKLLSRAGRAINIGPTIQGPDQSLWMIGVEGKEFRQTSLFTDSTAGPILMKMDTSGQVLQTWKFRNSDSVYHSFQRIRPLADGFMISGTHRLRDSIFSGIVLKFDWAGVLQWGREYPIGVEPSRTYTSFNAYPNLEGGYSLLFNDQFEGFFRQTDLYGNGGCAGNAYNYEPDSSILIQTLPYSLALTANLFEQVPVADSILVEDISSSIITNTTCFSLDTCEILNQFSTPTRVVCLDEAINFTNQSRGGTEFEWWVDDSLVSQNQDLIYTFEMAGYYRVRLTVSNDTCDAESSQIIQVRERGIANLGPDTTSIAGAILLDGYDPNVFRYNWSDGNGNDLGDKSQIGVTASGVYILSVEDVCGFSHTDAITVTLTGNGQYVSPGDVNLDGQINLADWLLLGLENGKTGPARSLPRSLLAPQLATAWTSSLPNTALGRASNLMHADCNGDGDIQIIPDGQVVLTNQNSVHPSYVEEGEDVSFRIEVLEPEVFLKDEIELGFFLEGKDGIVNDVYGIAFSVRLSFPLLTPPDLDATGSWLGNEGTDMATALSYRGGERRIDFGFTRTNQVSQTGNSLLGNGILIAVADDINDPWLFAKRVPLTLTLDNVLVMDASGNPIPVSVKTVQSTETVFLKIPDSTFFAAPRYFCHFVDSLTEELQWKVTEKNVLSYVVLERKGATVDTLGTLAGAASPETQDATYRLGVNYDPTASYELLIIGQYDTVRVAGFQNCTLTHLEAEWGNEPKWLNMGPLYPNPTAGQIHIPVQSQRSEQIEFDLYDLQGRILFSFEETLTPGRNLLTRTLPELAKGVYLLRAKTNEIQLTPQRIVLY